MIPEAANRHPVIDHHMERGWSHGARTGADGSQLLETEVRQCAESVSLSCW